MHARASASANNTAGNLRQIPWLTSQLNAQHPTPIAQRPTPQMPKPTKTAMPNNAPAKEYSVNKNGTMHKAGRDDIKHQENTGHTTISPFEIGTNIKNHYCKNDTVI